MKKRIEYIDTKKGKLKIYIYDTRKSNKKVPCLMWIHGGGYMIGKACLATLTRARDIMKNEEIVMVSPEYTLADKAPYPQALNDCYDTLLYINENSEKLGIDKNQIMVGGESAGGGLCLATTILARDQKKVDIKCIFPLYPMIDCDDTETSKDNHGYIWNTKRNHMGWKKYLRDLYQAENICPYASPAKLKDFSNMPPMYTFVCDGEPFYKETMDFVEKAKENGIDARVEVYHSKIHSFDMIFPFLKISKQAKKDFIKNYKDMMNKYVK